MSREGLSPYLQPNRITILKKLINYLLVTTLLCISSNSIAQQKHTVSGTIKDRKNGELMIGVTVRNCTTCAGMCVSGKIKMSATEGLTNQQLIDGYVLTCMGYPKYEDVVIELS